MLKSITKKWKNTKIISQTNKGPASATQKAIDFPREITLNSWVVTMLCLNFVQKYYWKL